MEELGLLKLLELVSQFGLAAVVLVIWYKSDRSRERMLNAYRDDTKRLLKEHEDHVEEIERMYKNNVHLAEGFLALSKDQKDVILMNTQAWSKALAAINGNEFCPQVRLRKDAPGKVEG